jgi:hypothetical protein
MVLAGLIEVHLFRVVEDGWHRFLIRIFFALRHILILPFRFDHWQACAG